MFLDRMFLKKKSFWVSLSFVLMAIFLLVILPPLRHPILLIRLFQTPLKTPLAVPVLGVSAHDLQNSWGAERSEGRHHEGIDIMAPRYTPVISTTEGIVYKRGLNRLGGRIVTILGPEGRCHYYAHLENWGTQKLGDYITAGTVIGFVGDSGNAKGTPTHLHYGIYSWYGKATNPYPYLTQDLSRKLPSR